VRPTPGDRGAWSHAPVARVQARHAAAPAEATAPEPVAQRMPTPSPARRSPYAGFPVRGVPPQRQLNPPARGGFGLPSLRRNVCPHFYMTGSRGAIPIQAPHLLKGLLRQPNNISRCQLRGGVHLDDGYVNDVCLTPRFNQCVFYEDDLTRE
jgi:hypothetical protein